MERLTKRWCGNVELASHVNEDCATICHNNLCEKCVIQKAFDKLAHYEDLEEQGLLLKLPCKVGDVVYRVLDDVYKFIVTAIYIYEDKVLVSMNSIEENCNDWEITTDANNVGKYFFLTKEEAEAKLQELQNGVTQSNDGVKEGK